MEKIGKMLEEEIVLEFEDLKNLGVGSEEYQKAIDNLATLYKLKLDTYKAEWEADDLYNRRLMEQNQKALENAQKEEQLSEQKKDRYFKIGIGAAELIIPLVFYGRWMKKGFKFEETGTFTSTTFRGLFGRFRPTK